MGESRREQLPPPPTATAPVVDSTPLPQTTRPGRRAPTGPADQGPVQGTRRDHEREAVEPARWVSIERGRIEVRFDGAEDALARLYTLAQALGNDLRRFQALVGR